MSPKVDILSVQDIICFYLDPLLIVVRKGIAS